MAAAFIQGVTGNTTSGTTTGTFSSSTTSGSLIVVTTSDDSGTTSNGVSVSDNKGNTYSKHIHQASGSTLSMWSCPNVTGGASHTITVTWSTAATGRLDFAAQEFSGIATSSPLDQSAFAGGSSNAPSVNSGATTQADELVVGGMTRDGSTSAISLGSGYTNLSTVNAANAGVAQESKVVAATGVQTVTFSIAASRGWIAGVLTFKAATTASPQTVSPSAISPAEAFGTATVSSTIALSPSGIGTAEAFGTPVVNSGPPVISPAGIASAEAFGTPTVTPGPITVTPAGIASAEDVGTPAVTSTITVSPAGIASEEAFGFVTLARIDPIYRLIQPRITERHIVDGLRIPHVTALTVYGTDAGLQAKERPKAHELEGMTYVFFGGYEYTTTDVALRDLWVSSGFEIERAN